MRKPVFFCFLMFCFVTNAQNKILISDIEQQLQKTTSDTEKIHLLNALSWEWSEYDFKKAKDYSHTALKLSQKVKDKRLDIGIYHCLANAFDYESEYDSSLLYYKKALMLSTVIDDWKQEGIICNNIGTVYHYQGMFDEAISYYVKSAKAYARLGDMTSCANSLNNIGVVYRNTGNFKDAIYIYQKSLAIKLKYYDNKGIYDACANLAVAFYDLDEPDSAFIYADSALIYAEKLNKQVYIASVLRLETPLYRDKKQYAKAILKDALELTKKIDNLLERVRYMSMLEVQCEPNEELNNALEFHQKTLKISRDLGQNTNTLRSLSFIANTYNSKFKFKPKYESLKDSLESNELVELKTKFETDLKDEEFTQTQLQLDIAQIEIKEHTRNFRFLLVIFILLSGLSAVLLFFFIQTNRNSQKIQEQRQKIEVALGENEALLREIHHRVKNNLQIISGLLELQEADSENTETKKMVDDAQNRIKSMSITHEMLYQTSDLAAINIEEYLNRLVQSIELSFASNFSVEKKNDINGLFFNIDTIIPLGLILNELITNSYKYAFSRKRENKLYISIKQTDNAYQLIFADNGKGLPDTVTNVDSQKSFGLRLINMLVRQLKGKIDYQFEQGAKFLILFYQK